MNPSTPAPQPNSSTNTNISKFTDQNYENSLNAFLNHRRCRISSSGEIKQASLFVFIREQLKGFAGKYNATSTENIEKHLITIIRTGIDTKNKNFTLKNTTELITKLAERAKLFPNKETKFSYLQSFIKGIEIKTDSVTLPSKSIVPCTCKLIGTSTTYLPKDKSVKDSLNGVLDFAHVDEQSGFAYVADGTGHGIPEVRQKLIPFWEKFNKTFADEYKNKKFNSTNLDAFTQDVSSFMREQFLNFSNQIQEDVKSASSLSFVLLTEFEGQKYALAVNIGDSSLFRIETQSKGLFKPSEKYYTLGDDLKAHTQNQEIGGLDKNSSILISLHEVNKGDTIFGVSDGITNFVKEETLIDIFSKHSQTTDSSLVLTDIETAIKTGGHKNSYGQVWDANDRNNSDDIGFFKLVVP